MDRPAGPIAGKSRKAEALPYDALSGESGVAMVETELLVTKFPAGAIVTAMLWGGGSCYHLPL